MPRRLLLALTLLALAGCGSDDATPTSVVREWSDAVNANDNRAAALLFADGARVVQGDSVETLHDEGDALTWHLGLPCAGEIVAVEERGEEVTATFELGERPLHRCDGPGERVRALFRVRDGKIVFWHQLAGLPRPESAAATRRPESSAEEIDATSAPVLRA